jgi:hypothetical protein
MVGVPQFEFRLWIDAAVRDYNSRRGWILQLADPSWALTDTRNIIAWRSVKDRNKHSSSTSAEVNAIYQCLLEVDDQFFLAQKLVSSATVRIFSDSMSGILQVANGGHTLRDKERAKFIRDLIGGLPFPVPAGLEHVSGLINLADPMTKAKSLGWYARDTDYLT